MDNNYLKKEEKKEEVEDLLLMENSNLLDIHSGVAQRQP
jgi:hypothetical protein